MWIAGEKADYYRQVVKIIPGVAGTGNLGATFTWDDQPDIRNARLIAMEAYFVSDLAFCQPQGVQVIPDNLAPLVSLKFETNDPDDTLFAKGKPGGFLGTLDTIKYLPLTAIHINQTQNGAASGSFVRSQIFWKNRYILWQKSEIWIGGGGLRNTGDVAIVLGCYYSFLTVEGTPLPRT